MSVQVISPWVFPSLKKSDFNLNCSGNPITPIILVIHITIKLDLSTCGIIHDDVKVNCYFYAKRERIDFLNAINNYMQQIDYFSRQIYT